MEPSEGIPPIVRPASAAPPPLAEPSAEARAEPAPPAPVDPGSPWPFRAMTLALIVIVFTLVRLGSQQAMTPEAQRSARATRLYVEAVLSSKTAYAVHEMAEGAAASPTGAASRPARDVLRTLEQLASLVNTPRSIRRLAVMQAAFNDPRWPATLRRLATTAPAVTGPDLASETALWTRVFGQGSLPRTERPAIERRIRGYGLGWFERPALVSLLRRTGDREGASLLVLRSVASVGIAGAMMGAALLVGLAGLVLGVVFVVSLRRHGRFPDFLPASMQPVPVALRTHPQSNLLYGVFLIYISSFLALHVLRGGGAASAARGAAESSQGVNLVMTLLVMGLMIVAPIGVLLWKARATGFRPADIGLRARPVWPEIAWGVLGYMLAMPLLAIVTMASSALPGADNSAIHPIVNEAGASGSAATAILLVVLASVAAPLTEETMFRGVLFNALAPRAGIVWSVIASAAVFSLLHPQLPVGGPPIFLLGAAFSCLYLLRGSLVAPMVAHAINNGVAMALMLLVFSG